MKAGFAQRDPAFVNDGTVGCTGANSCSYPELT